MRLAWRIGGKDSEDLPDILQDLIKRLGQRPESPSIPRLVFYLPKAPFALWPRAVAVLF